MAHVAHGERMDADAFLAWAERQPEGRWELHDGRVVAMAPERVRHAETKFAATAALKRGIRAGGLRCQAFIDGVSVRIGKGWLFEPDAMVRCGDDVDGDAVAIDDPVIVIEVLSPSTATRDMGSKMRAYFELPSLRHYLLLDPEERMAIHHRRAEGDRIETRLLTEGALALEPPGLSVDVAALFPEPPADGQDGPPDEEGRPEGRP